MRREQLVDQPQPRIEHGQQAPHPAGPGVGVGGLAQRRRVGPGTHGGHHLEAASGGEGRIDVDEVDLAGELTGEGIEGQQVVALDQAIGGRLGGASTPGLAG